MSKVLDMIVDERVRELRMRGGDPNTSSPQASHGTIPKGERQGYKIIDIVGGEEGIIVHQHDDRLRVLGLGLDSPNWSASPFSRRAKEESVM